MLICVCAVTVWDPIYFKAYLGRDLILNKEKDIIFRDVINNVSEGYNSTSGRFVAPRSGTYLFIVSVLPQPGDGAEWKAKFGAEVWIKVNGIKDGYAGSPTFCKSSGHGITHLKAGQEVWICTGPHKISLHMDVATYFSGVLLYPSN